MFDCLPIYNTFISFEGILTIKLLLDETKDPSTYPWVLTKGWMSIADCESSYEQLLRNLNWKRHSIKLFGRISSIPRMTCFIGPVGLSYSYSGFKNTGCGWPIWFLPILNAVSSKCGVEFNGCLLNLYRDGSDKMGWHSDNEKEIDPVFPIASLSLGESRDILFKHNKSFELKKIQLCSGDLLVMYPPCQLYWKHSVPVRKRVSNGRISLTFRRFY